MKKILQDLVALILIGSFGLLATGCSLLPSSLVNLSTPAINAKIVSSPPVLLQAASFPEISKTSACQEKNGLPDAACTPGAIDPSVTQATISSTICTSGYTDTVRPSEAYTNHLKTQQIAAYGYADTNPSDYEEDHLVSLELGGSPSSPANLWPEPSTISYSSKEKDKVENYLHSQVCKGSLSLAQAQREIATNWETAYTSYYPALNLTSGVDFDDSPTAISPTPSSFPSGSTGVCKDGTYTMAINHQGACSDHGGVSRWISP